MIVLKRNESRPECRPGSGLDRRAGAGGSLSGGSGGRYDIVCDVTALVPYDITYDSRLLFTVDVIYVMSYMIS